MVPFRGMRASSGRSMAALVATAMLPALVAAAGAQEAVDPAAIHTRLVVIQPHQQGQARPIVALANPIGPDDPDETEGHGRWHPCPRAVPPGAPDRRARRAGPGDPRRTARRRGARRGRRGSSGRADHRLAGRGRQGEPDRDPTYRRPEHRVAAGSGSARDEAAVRRTAPARRGRRNALADRVPRGDAEARTGRTAERPTRRRGAARGGRGAAVAARDDRAIRGRAGDPRGDPDRRRVARPARRDWSAAMPCWAC